MVRPKAKFWPKAEIRHKAKLQPKRPLGIAVAPSVFRIDFEWTTNWKLKTYLPTKDWFDLKQLVECRSRTADKLVVLVECKPRPADKLDGLTERESKVADKIFWDLSVAAIDCSTKDSGSDFYCGIAHENLLMLR
jgi:hypothetical protein